MAQFAEPAHGFSRHVAGCVVEPGHRHPSAHAFQRACSGLFFGPRNVARPGRGHLLFLKVLLGDRPLWRSANGQNPDDVFNRSAEEF